MLSASYPAGPFPANELIRAGRGGTLARREEPASDKAAGPRRQSRLRDGACRRTRRDEHPDAFHTGPPEKDGCRRERYSKGSARVSRFPSSFSGVRIFSPVCERGTVAARCCSPRGQRRRVHEQASGVEDDPSPLQVRTTVKRRRSAGAHGNAADWRASATSHTTSPTWLAPGRHSPRELKKWAAHEDHQPFGVRALVDS